MKTAALNRAGARWHLVSYKTSEQQVFIGIYALTTACVSVCFAEQRAARTVALNSVTDVGTMSLMTRMNSKFATRF